LESIEKPIKKEGNETVTNCNRLKLQAADGKMPEDLPTPDKSIKQIEHERKNQLKKK